MRKYLAALAAVTALAVPAVANAGVEITAGPTSPIPTPANDFQAKLSALGLTKYSTTGSSIVLTEGHVIQFHFLGSESGFSDTFTAGSISWTETSSFEDHFAAPFNLGVSSFAAGSLAGVLNFTSDGGKAATVGQDGFALLLPTNFGSKATLGVGDTFYFAYDDEITNQDDNHDDFIIRATILPAVPEPSTWALMILGFGAIGFGMRSRKANERIRVTYA